MKEKIKIKYTIKEEGNIRIFGAKFVKNNKEKLKMEINREIIKLNEYYYYQNVNNNLEIILIGTEKVTDMSYMFCDCSSLKELKLDNFNTKNVEIMEEMFSNCTSIEYLPVNNFNTDNVSNMTEMFNSCSSLKDISLMTY